MKHCKNCGEKSEDSVKFCPNCGKSFFVETDGNNHIQQKSFWSKAFSTSGRLNRLKYFVYRLKILGTLILSALPLGITLKTPLESFGLMIFAIIAIAAIISSMTIMIRRLHDLNFTGWLVTVYFVLLTLDRIARGEELLFSIPTIIFELWLLFIKGTAGSNQYGEDPLKTE